MQKSSAADAAATVGAATVAAQIAALGASTASGAASLVNAASEGDRRNRDAQSRLEQALVLLEQAQCEATAALAATTGGAAFET